MQGEFRGDFSRDSFDPRRHFSRVLMQQGRVQLDADWNEQAAILLHYLQTLAADLIGPYGGSGFEITTDAPTGFTIGRGHYYVDGILCENEPQLDDNGNEVKLGYYSQLHYPIGNKENNPLPNAFLVYLDVWERHVSVIEDDRIREVALEGADTATRAQVVWQVKVSDKLLDGITKENLDTKWKDLTEQWQPLDRGLLKAKGKQRANADAMEPCITAPEARYQGAQNQLYRVEIHRGGTAKEDGIRATFKWSRENSSIALPIVFHQGNNLTVGNIGRDPMLGINNEQWVEIIDDTRELLGQPGTLVRVVKVEGQTLTIDPGQVAIAIDLEKHPKVRRWDYQGKDPKNGNLALANDNALVIKEGGDENWLTLEDGIQIQFQLQPNATYRTGDYWLIPARTATGDIEWMLDADQKPIKLPPHGVEHHYAPLAILPDIGDCRKKINPIVS